MGDLRTGKIVWEKETLTDHSVKLNCHIYFLKVTVLTYAIQKIAICSEIAVKAMIANLDSQGAFGNTMGQFTPPMSPRDDVESGRNVSPHLDAQRGS
jgi:hypothetical protein